MTTRKDYDRIGHSGQLAWKRLQKGGRDWGDWYMVGEALAAGRELAMRGAETNRPEGSAYNQLFGEWLVRYGLQNIDKSDRAKLLKIVEQPEILEWRQSLPQNERMKLNHPSSVWRHWQKATQVTKPKSIKKPKAADLNDEIAQLRAENEELIAARETPKPLTIEHARKLYAAFLTDLTFDEYEAEMDMLRVESGNEPKARES